MPLGSLDLPSPSRRRSRAQAAYRFDSGIVLERSVAAGECAAARPRCHSQRGDRRVVSVESLGPRGRVSPNRARPEHGRGRVGGVWADASVAIGAVHSGAGHVPGQALSSRDTTGYDWVNGTSSGHTPRYSYSEGFRRGSAGLTIEVPVYRWIARCARRRLSGCSAARRSRGIARGRCLVPDSRCGWDANARRRTESRDHRAGRPRPSTSATALFVALELHRKPADGPDTFGASIKILVAHDTVVVGDSSAGQAQALDAQGTLSRD